MKHEFVQSNECEGGERVAGRVIDRIVAEIRGER